LEVNQVDIIDIILKRRSIRKYTQQKVDEDTLHRLLQAAMAAPSAVNSQPWEFIVVTDPDKLAEMYRNLPYGRYDAPAAIVVCANPSVASNRDAAERFWVQDCSAATENILIAAAGLGLGTVWCGVYPESAREKAIAYTFALPEGVIPLNVILVGYPAEEKPPRTQYKEERIHWQFYGSEVE
jgi:nitroreductase